MASNQANSSPSSSQSPSNSLTFVVNPLPSTDDQLNERILDAADKIRYRSGNNSYSSNLPILNFYNNSAAANNNLTNSGLIQPQTSNSSNASNNQSLLLPPPPPPQADLSFEQSPARVNVSQCVISRKYVAVLLEDSRVCRFRYSIHPDRLSNPTAPIDQNAATNKRCLNNSPSSGPLSTGTNQSSQRALSTRRRLIRSSARPRTSASVIMGRGHVIPAQYVPEELVNQAQVVLQGKSRNIIIRELQRTNLDVNLAVNNLLSRDDEDFDDADDGQEQMIQSSDDLVSLLESGLQNDHSVIIDSDFADEVFSYPLRIRSGQNALFPPSGGTSSSGGNNAAGGSGSSGNSSSGGSRPSRLRDDTFSFLERDLQFASTVSGSKNRLYYSVGDPKSDLNNLNNSNVSRQKKSSDSLQLAPMSFTDQQEFWPGGQDKKFVAIASIYNELIAITAQGQLCQWRWQDAEPFKAQYHDGAVYYHPKVPSLGLLSEKITLLSGSCIRATVATESGKLATWIDDSIAPIAASKLEHAATNSIFTDTISSGSSKIAALYVSSLMSCVQLSSGTLFWWGIPPFSHRKKLVEKVKNDRSKSKSKSSTGTSTSNTILKDNEIVLGSIVCLRNSPIYQNGAIGFTTVGGEPKVGQLINSAWKITDSCSFRILSHQEIHYRSASRSLSNVSQQMAKDYSVSSVAGTSLDSGLSSNIKSSEMTRTEMPPPPSPASSTSSEPSYNPPLPKRSKTRNPNSSQNSGSISSANNQDREQQLMNAIERVETWNLKDVVFMEDVKSLPIGRIVKVDGQFVAVKFNHLSSNSASADNNNLVSNQTSLQHQQSRTNSSGVVDLSLESFMQECRLMRKDELIILKSSSYSISSQMPSTSSSISLGKAYDCLQRYPKRIHVPEHVQILAMTLTNLGLHAIAKIGGYRYSYILINIMTGRIEQDAKISIECSTFFGNCANPKSSLIRLYSAGESDTTTVVVCRDGNGTLYPLAKDCTETVIREPISLNLGPVSTVALGVFALPNQISLPSTTNSSTSLNSSGNSANVPKTHAAILGLAFESQYLMSSILKSDLDLLRERLSLLERFPHIYHSMINEICDGNHNILHIAVTSCYPTSNSKHSLVEMNISHILEIDEAIPMDRNSSINDSFNTSQTNDNSSDAPNSQSQKGHFDSSSAATEPLLDPSEQKPIAHSILWTLLDSPILAPYLFDLLSARDFQGHTPFMLAVAGRAYSAANQLFIVMQRVARQYATSNSTLASTTPAYQDLYQRTFMQMLYPRGSLPDHSPLYMLCSNDTCSFTWTGEEHINQDIFECRTCGLVGSLCCCTECARVCHRGHDCKLKRTSPTAYCDCWEKCKCKALISGCQPARYLLLKRILSSTDLSIRVNSRGEHILLFLVQTVGRQIVEQKQYRPSRLRSSNSSSSRSKAPTDSATEEHTNVPEHDLEPPKFSRRALEKLLCDWPTVKSMILIGYRAPENTVSKRRNYLCTFFNGTANAYANEEENAYLARQNGSALLDKFTHLLLRIGLDMVERLIMTILTACKSSVEARVVARRFVRSVARVGLVICFELNPTLYANIPNQNVLIYTLIDRALGTNSTLNSNGSSSGSSSSSKKNSAISMLSKCRRIFLSFLPIAVEELCEITESLIAPVKMGVARPSAPFALSPNNNEAMASVDDIFAVDTSIYAHQSDFLDSSFGLDILEEPPPVQENLAPNISEFSYENPPLASVNDLLAERASGASGTVASSDVLLNRNNDSDIMRMDTTPAPSMSHNVFDPNVPSTSGNELLSQANILGSVASTSGSTSSSNTQPLNSEATVSVSAMDDSYHRHHDDIVIIGEMLGGSEHDEDNSNVGGRDTESDSESNPDDASYLSNADNASAQRSVVTGATAGSDVGVASLPYDDESINSNVDDVDVDDDEDDDAEGEENDDDEDDEDDASDAAETEPETEEISAFIDETLDRPSNNATGNFSSSTTNNNNTNTSRSNILQHVQWALRGQRESIAGATASTTQDSSFRRTAVANTLTSGENAISMSNSAIGLSRAFSIIIRQIADLLPLLRDPSELSTSGIHYLSFTPAEAASIQQAIEERLRNTWSWLITIMDSTETQLRFGCALSNRRVTSTLSSPLVTSATTSAAIPSVSFSSNTTSNRFNRLRAFQNHDDMLFLPTLSRTTSSSLRRMAGLFGRTSGSSSGVTNAAGSSAVGSTSVSANAAAASSSGLSLDSSASRRDFLNYTMSLMRSHSNEQYDSLPVLDVSSLKHVAYVFDSFVYYIRRGLVIPFESTTNYSSLVDDISELNFDFYQTAPPPSLFMENVDSEMASVNEEKSPVANYEPNVGRNHGFFRRSNSTLYLGCPPPDPFSAPFHEALPLANKPHLLQPNARREQLFGIPRPSNLVQAEEMIKSLPSQLSLTKRQTPQQPSSQSVKTSISYGSSQGFSATTTPTTPQRNQSVIIQQSVTPTTPTKPSVIVLAGSVKHHSQTGDQQLPPSYPSKNQSNSGQNSTHLTSPVSNEELQSEKQIYFGNQQQHDFLLGRWRLSLELFGRLFVEDVGLEPSSIITELSGFPIKESRFRREIERLRIASTSTSFTSNSNSQRDINFHKLDRDRGVLLQQTFKELNSVFSTHSRRLSSNTTVSPQTIAISRVKVTFKDEPGEGSGVARSFYTAFSEAVLANEKLPALDVLISNSSAGASSGRNSGSFSVAPYNFQYNLIHVSRGGVTPPTSNAISTSQSNHYALRAVDDSVSTLRRPRSPGRLRLFTPRRSQPIERTVTIRNEFRSSSSNSANNGTSSSNLNGQSSLPASSSRSRSNGPVLRYDSASFVPTQFLNFANRFTPPLIPADSRTTLGNRIYSRVYPLQPNHAAKITGMFLDLPSHDLIPILTSDEEFRIQLEQAVEIINSNESNQQRQSNNASSSVASSGSAASQIASAPIEASNDQQQHSIQMESNLLDISANTSSGKISSAHFKSAESLAQSDLPEEEDNEPLFYQPGPRGFYSPRSGRCSEARLNAFRNVGRIIGICFVQNELCPITFNRHVIKIILGRPVSWHDLAFFDSDLYESLRQMILDAESSNKDEIFAQLDFNFVIDLGPEEGGHEIELIPNGRNIHVTPQNVYDYVRRYALYRMFDSQLASIQAIRAGIFDVLPSKTFDGLTAEDFRLLLNGVNEINIQLLQSYVTFHDESGDGSEHLSYFRRWFWWVVERMTNEEKQDLIYFWTGSPALPASEEGFQPMPSITIRPRDDCYFVTANTCISRLYIPLYSSRTILRQKLLVSIKSKSFGFI